MLKVSSVEAEAIAKIAWRSLRRCRELPEGLRKATFLEAFARKMPITHDPDELLTGSAAFGRQWPALLSPEERAEMSFHGNIGHVIVDYGRVLRLGVAGLRQQVAAMSAGVNQEACGRAVDAFSAFIRRHADGASPVIAELCEQLAVEPPRSFREALQLVWLTQVFLHAEANASAISFGRFDQYLWPYLERDLADGITTAAAAEDLLGEFWRKCCPGYESQNLVVGGVDAAGRSAENPLSLMVLRGTRRLRLWQPSVSVRIHAGTSPEFWDLALDLCREGFGMPSFFNDPCVIRSLEALGIPLGRARDYGIVGCYEANPQGDTHGLTVAAGYTLPAWLLDFLAAPPSAAGFPEFVNAFKKYHDRRYQEELASFQQRWDWMCAQQASPFESVCLTGCLESGRMAEEGGAAYSLYGVNVLGLGTVVDSLLAIRELVFDTSQLNLAAFTEQLRKGFPDRALQARCRNLPGKYGTDDPESNELVRDLSQHIADTILASRMAHGVRPYPAFFRFLRDVYESVPATPDGRGPEERLSYGAGPGVMSSGMTATSILNSAAHVAHDRCACGTPLTISLSRQDLAGAGGRERLRELVSGYFAQGGFHLHFNIVGVDELQAAMASPQEHAALLVRISGYSARFTGLDRRVQEAIVERTALGM